MFVPNMAPFLCLRDSCCCSAMTRSSPPCAASLGEQEKPDMTSWILAGRANAAKPRREMRKTMATSSPISVLFAVQKSTKLRTSKSGKLKGNSLKSLGEKEIHFSEGEKRLLETLASHDGKGSAIYSSKVLFKSIGSRSSPSRSSIPGRRSKYSKPDPKLIKQASSIVSNSIGMKQLLHYTNSEDEMMETDDEEEIDFGWCDSDSENDEKGKYYAQLNLNAVKGITSGLNSHKSQKAIEVKDNENKERTTSQEDETISFNKRDLVFENQIKKNKLIGFKANKGIKRLKESENPAEAKHEQETDDEEEIDFEWYDSDLEDDKKGNYYEQPNLNAVKGNTSGLNLYKSHKAIEVKENENNERTTSQEEETISFSRRDLVFENQIKKNKLIWLKANKGIKSLKESDNPAETKHEQEPTYSNHDTSQHSSLPSNLEEASSWKRHPLCDLPFEIQYSYSETPTNIPILGLRENLSPFGPTTMRRPWTGLPPVRRRRHLDNAVNPVLRKFILNCYPEGPARKSAKSREGILGTPLTKEEITLLVNKCHQENRQVNLGRDGLTHNMLYLVHTHWKARPVCKIKCRGVPTVDMDNLSFHVEDKTGGKIIYRSGGVLYVFRGRNYSYKTRPRIPLMLWKPASPIYPMLVPKAPVGLTGEEAFQLRVLGQKVEPLCKLDKNGVYLNLVNDVRDAFLVDDLVVLDYDGLKSTDYKKMAAKLRDLVPCIILSFRNRQILLWKGRGTDTSLLDAKVHSDALKSFKAVDEQPSTVRQEIKSENLTLDESSETSLGKQCRDSFGRLSSDVSQSELYRLHGQDDDRKILTCNKRQDCYANSPLATGLNRVEECTIMPPTIDQNNVNLLYNEALIDDVSWEADKDFHAEECTPTLDRNNMNGLYNEASIIGVECTSIHPIKDRNIMNESYDEASIGDDLGALWCPKNVNLLYDESSINDNLDALWDLALRCEMALDLENVNNLDADIIMQKTHTFCKVAPIGPDYSKKLIHRLRIEVDHERKEQQFEVHFYTKYRKPKHR